MRCNRQTPHAGYYKRTVTACQSAARAVERADKRSLQTRADFAALQQQQQHKERRGPKAPVHGRAMRHGLKGGLRSLSDPRPRAQSRGDPTNAVRNGLAQGRRAHEPDCAGRCSGQPDDADRLLLQRSPPHITLLHMHHNTPTCVHNHDIPHNTHNKSGDAQTNLPGENESKV